MLSAHDAKAQICRRTHTTILLTQFVSDSLRLLSTAMLTVWSHPEASHLSTLQSSSNMSSWMASNTTRLTWWVRTGHHLFMFSSQDQFLPMPTERYSKYSR